MKSKPADILVVDDNLDNLSTVKTLLLEEGYNVRCVTSGKMAISSSNYQIPALMLLDVLMPEMDGYEVCRQLKTNPKTAEFPVIFLSALDDLQNQIDGFEVGGVDFISKPIQKEELYARIRTHLALYFSKIKLKEQSDLFEQRVLTRTSELNETNRILESIVNSIVGLKGQELFDSIVKTVCDIFQCECSILGEFSDAMTISALAMALDGKFIQNYKYEMAGTPCEKVTEKGYCIYEQNVSKLFPEDRDLIELRAEGYVGIPLYTKNKEPLGIINAVSRSKLEIPPNSENILKILSTKVAGEIERRRAEQALKNAHEELEMKVAERTEALQQEIEERKQLEAYLMEARKEAEFANSAKSEFLSNLSHEFRTPMHQILSYAKFGVDKLDKVNKEKLLHYFTKISTIGKNLLVLLNDLLDLSKLESGKLEFNMQQNDLKQMIDAVSNEFASIKDERGIILSVNKGEVSTKIICDGYKIEQVIRNLFSNAIKFSPKGEKITITIKPGAYESRSGLLVKISDQGIGIPNDELENVFDKFIQSSKTKTNAGGTGLGLPICKKIILAHKGNIWAENNNEGGATFSFLLPYNQN